MSLSVSVAVTGAPTGSPTAVLSGTVLSSSASGKSGEAFALSDTSARTGFSDFASAVLSCRLADPYMQH